MSDPSFAAAGGWERHGVMMTNEFASVRVSLDRRANGDRLLVENLESGAQVLLDPLELASFCQASEADRIAWLHVGSYRDDHR